MRGLKGTVTAEEFCDAQDPFDNAIASMQGPEVGDAFVFRALMGLVADTDSSEEARTLWEGFARWCWPNTIEEERNSIHFENTVIELYRQRGL